MLCFQGEGRGETTVIEGPKAQKTKGRNNVPDGMHGEEGVHNPIVGRRCEEHTDGEDTHYHSSMGRAAFGIRRHFAAKRATLIHANKMRKNSPGQKPPNAPSGMT